MDRSQQAVAGGGPPAGGERRRAPRVATRLEAGYEDRERQLFLPTLNLSESGVFLLAEDGPEPEVGAPVRLLLELPGRSELLRLSGNVARHSRAEPRGFAVRFDARRAGDRDQTALRSYLADLGESG